MKKITLVSVGVCLVAAGCGGNGSNSSSTNLDTKNQTPTIALEAATKKLTDQTGTLVVNADNEFGLSVFQSLVKSKPNDTVFISPTSLALCLHMAYNGAAGETEKAMSKALRLDGISMDQVNDANIGLRSLMMSADPKVELSTANSVWLRQGFDVRQEFLDKNRSAYGMNVNNLNFTDPKSVDIINQWCSDNTKGRIPKIIDEIQPDDMMFLINAVYFKGKWSTPFKPENTKEGDFTAENGKQSKPMMMSLSDKFAYKQGENYQAIRLPYGDGRLGMIMILPKEGFGASKFVDGLDYEKWQAYIAGMTSKEGRVVIPRVKFTGDYPLTQTLKTLGFGEMLDPNKADFTRIRTQKDIFVSAVKQKTFLEINEEGTEAAAVTEGTFGATSAPMPEKPFEFIANRPFVFAIVDSNTKAILFIGLMRNP